MAAAAYLKQLESKHAHLDDKIKEEQKLPQPDGLRISTLKKQKLHLKEQIHAVQTS